MAPPASMYDFSFLAPCPSSGLFVHGDADDVVPLDSVGALAEKLSAQRGITIDYRIVKGATHFFHDHIEALGAEIEAYLDENYVPDRERGRRVGTGPTAHAARTFTSISPKAAIPQAIVSPGPTAPGASRSPARITSPG